MNLSTRRRKSGDIGGDRADFAAVERLRAEHVLLREQAIAKMRAMVARGGKGLQ